MAKVQFNCRLPEEVVALINSEVERLEAEVGKNVSQADVITMAVIKWCDPASGVVAGTGDEGEGRRASAEAAMKEAEARPAEAPPTLKLKARAESVAERKAREAREHAAALAESDTVARMVGRDDIEYDLENVTHRSAIAGRAALPKAERVHYDVQPRKVQQLARPHGNADPKRRREQ